MISGASLGEVRRGQVLVPALLVGSQLHKVHGGCPLETCNVGAACLGMLALGCCYSSTVQC
jgi:hypothetical protein